MAHLLGDDADTSLVGNTGAARLVVTDRDTAIAVGSGDVPVFATPRMIALMEQAAVQALAGELPAGVTTVGVHVDIRHLRPSPVAAVIIAEARVSAVNGDRINFEVTATHDAGLGTLPIGSGTHVRVAVDAAAFVAGLDAEG